MRLNIAALAVAFALVPYSAQAQDYEQSLNREEQHFQQYDMNLNGSLELNEFASFGMNRGWNEAQIVNVFNRSDINQDGTVTFSEFWEYGGGTT